MGGGLSALLLKREENTFKLQTWRAWRNSLRNIKSEKYQEVANQYQISEEQKKEIDRFYLSTYGEKIPYDCHKYYAAHSGIMNPQYFPDFMLYAYFERYMNLYTSYNHVYGNKNVFPYMAQSAGVKIPVTLAKKVCGVLLDGDNNIITENELMELMKDKGTAFCKPSIGSSGGSGCFAMDFGTENYQSCHQKLLSLGKDFIIQQKVISHSSISELYPLAVNTFRVITYRWKDDFVSMPVFMRVGQGGAVVDNGAAGGMFVGVKPDGSLTDKAVMSYNTNIPNHPDTGVPFKGHVIKHFPKVVDAAIRLHQFIPQAGIVYWDFTIDSEGDPVLIECNISNGTIYAVQMTHGVPAFGDRTAEILRWIKKMKKTPYPQLKDHAFGNF